MSQKYTILDIAKRAGVSRGTVSRVLNNHPSVSDTTRHIVLDVIKELDYSPNYSARALRTASSNLIGLVTDGVITTPFAFDIIRGVQETLLAHNKITIVIEMGYDSDILQTSLQTLLERRIEGFIYATMYHHAIELPEELKDIPVVLANCFVQDASVPSVVPDEASGGYNATKALIDQGHTRIGFINLWSPWETRYPPAPAAAGRLEGYRKALEEANIPFDKNLLRFSDQRPKTNYALTLELMDMDKRPTAIFCGNDRTAMGCYNALISRSLRIPEDVAVIGFDNQDLVCEALYPSLTTIQLPHYAMGQWAAEYLMNHQNTPDDHQPPQHKLECPLVMRNSI